MASIPESESTEEFLSAKDQATLQPAMSAEQGEAPTRVPPHTVNLTEEQVEEGGIDDLPFKILWAENCDGQPGRWVITLDFCHPFPLDVHEVCNALRSVGGLSGRCQTPSPGDLEKSILPVLNEFLDEARENPSIDTLEHLAGFKGSTVFFRFSAFEKWVRYSHLSIKPRCIEAYLKKSGFKSKAMRFGRKVVWVWVHKALECGETDAKEDQ